MFCFIIHALRFQSNDKLKKIIKVKKFNFLLLFLSGVLLYKSGMFDSIKNYFKKAKEEISRESSIGFHETNSSKQNEQSADPAKRALPDIWTGVDLDGTLAYHDISSSMDKIGEPVPAMMELVKKMISHGVRVKIFTARAQDPEQLPIILKWLKDNNLPELEITNIKDYYTQRIYDDRCIQVERNTGRLIVDK